VVLNQLRAGTGLRSAAPGTHRKKKKDAQRLGTGPFQKNDNALCQRLEENAGKQESLVEP